MEQAEVNARIERLDDAEIATLMQRGRAFHRLGMPAPIAAAWADRLALRDQEQETRVFCPECKHLKTSGLCAKGALSSRNHLLTCHLFKAV
jgi:hypothetical protein